jgi:hypothetical protein
MLYLYKKEKHQRRIKEHYEAQFEVSSAYWPKQHALMFIGDDADVEMAGTVMEKESDRVLVTGEGSGDIGLRDGRACVPSRREGEDL